MAPNTKDNKILNSSVKDNLQPSLIPDGGSKSKPDAQREVTNEEEQRLRNLSQKDVAETAALSFLLPFAGYMYLRKWLWGILCLITLNFLFLGRFIVPLHTRQIVRKARNDLDEAGKLPADNKNKSSRNELFGFFGWLGGVFYLFLSIIIAISFIGGFGTSSGVTGIQLLMVVVAGIVMIGPFVGVGLFTMPGVRQKYFSQVMNTRRFKWYHVTLIFISVWPIYYILIYSLRTIM